MPEPRQPVASEAGRFDAGEQEPILWNSISAQKVFGQICSL
jgi:hypothetical protein